jgi:hypothetical protein
MIDTQVVVSSQTTSAAIPVDPRQAAFAIGFGLVITGTGTYKVQHTFDNVQDSTVTPTWFDHPVVTGKTASTDGNYAFPIRAVRLNCTAFTNGSGTLRILQGGKI